MALKEDMQEAEAEAEESVKETYSSEARQASLLRMTKSEDVFLVFRN
jgi:hypothetical protein